MGLLRSPSQASQLLQGLGWRDAWALRLGDLGEKNRLPRGFNAKNLRDTQG
ncbi:hypothetical protein D3C78_628280 [compost metagenome]